MKNTKTKILATALHLFNKLGLAQVTLRTIAKEMGISQGNLNYHFKKREDIIEALYHELVEKMDAFFIQEHPDGFHLKTIYHLSQTMMNNFYEYRFFMLDFVHIMRTSPSIQQHYSELSSLRKIQTRALLTALIDFKLMREEEFKEEYDALHIRMQILGDFWLSSAITTQDLSPQLIDHYCQILFLEFYPYLTPKGKKQLDFLTLKKD